MKRESRAVDSIHAYVVDAAGTRLEEISIVGLIMRDASDVCAARRTARSIQLSLFLPEFTDVSAIIKDRCAILPARINRPFNGERGKERKRERKIGERGARDVDVAGRENKRGGGKWFGDRSPRDLIRLVGKIHAARTRDALADDRTLAMVQTCTGR